MDCENCVHVKNFETRLSKTEKTVEEKGDGFEMRITKLERRVDVSDQKFLQIFEKLDEIISIIKERNSRMPNLAYTVIGVILGSTISGMILWAIAK